MEDFGPNYVTISDEDGKTYEMEILARFEYLDKEYLALIPADESEDDPSTEVNILRIEDEDGEELLTAIDDDNELQGAYDALMELVFEDEQE